MMVFLLTQFSKEIERKKAAGEILMPNIDEGAVYSRNPPPDSPADKIGF